MEGIQRNRAISGSHSLSPQHWGLSYQVEGHIEQGLSIPCAGWVDGRVVGKGGRGT